MKAISAYWCFNPNFGDALTPWLLEKITGRSVGWREPSETDDVTGMMVTGSILSWAQVKNSCVCGLGYGRWDEAVITPKEVRLVRGPLSWGKLASIKAAGPKVLLGDPALLLPLYHKPSEKNGKVAIVPHFVDFDVAMEYWGEHDDVVVVNLLHPIEKVVTEMTGCRAVISSSLHGLVAAHAYGIPATWVSFGDKLCGDGFKFLDYLMSQGYGKVQAFKVKPTNLTIAIEAASLPPKPINPQQVLQAFQV